MKTKTKTITKVKPLIKMNNKELSEFSSCIAQQHCILVETLKMIIKRHEKEFEKEMIEKGFIKKIKEEMKQ